MNVRRPKPADAEAVAELIAAYDSALGAPPGESADDVRSYWQRLDLDRDAWLFELDGRLAAVASVHGRGEELLQGDGYVHPDFTGRGLGTEIVRLTEERARERGAARLHNGTLHADARGRELFESNGYSFVRGFLRMGIELSEAPPEPVVPVGLTLRPATPEDDAAVHAAAEEAFEDHWEHHPATFEDWQRHREGSDRSLWRVVLDGEEVAAVSMNDLERFGAGWIGTLATRRRWRGRGLAQALLLASLGEFWRRGQRTVQLGVDASNPTGAVRLYERVGMHVVWRADVYEKHL